MFLECFELFSYVLENKHQKNLACSLILCLQRCPSPSHFFLLKLLGKMKTQIKIVYLSDKNLHLHNLCLLKENHWCQ